MLVERNENVTFASENCFMTYGRLLLGIAVTSALFVGSVVKADCEGCYPDCREITLKSLVRMDAAELACLYQQLQPGDLPSGYYTGRAIYKAGTPMTVPTAGAIRILWQGKYIDACQGIMTNKVLGGKAVRAAIYHGESWMDGCPAIIMDYAPFSKWAGRARDEIRQVRPGLYLGCMYIREKCGKRFSMFFAIERKDCCPASPCECSSCSAHVVEIAP